MRKLLLLPAVAFMMASCGGEDLCSCIQMSEERFKKFEEATKDIDPEDYEAYEKATDAIDKEFDYISRMEACEKLDEEYEKEYKALSSEEEKEAFNEKMEKEINDCVVE
tara:strand:- start:110 stop:436 length:327 start_codon:yes stop_codon:yes gene_type:complete